MKVALNDTVPLYQIVGDLPGVEMPDDLTLETGRFVNDEWLDARDLTTFYIDPDGTRQALPGPDRQELDCSWNEPLVRDGDVWRTKTASERLKELKLRLQGEVDGEAERERMRWITGGAGQAMTYQAKAAEAERFLADPSPVPSSYPLLSAEIGITAEDLAGVAAVVRAEHTAWLTAGAAIEAARLGTKRAIAAASNEADARAAREAVEWPEAPASLSGEE